MTRRIAIYWTPAADDPLAHFGSSWLGRDVEAGTPVPQPTVQSLVDCGIDLSEITALARVYGFHATLKAPFEALGASVEPVEAAMEAFSDANAPVEGPPLVPAVLGGFVALVPERPSHAVDRLADRIVETFDVFRGPPTPKDLERRRKLALTERQDGHLVKWGYPYVFEDFFFHLTLSRRLAPDQAEVVRAAVANRFGDQGRRPLRIDSLCLFEQPSRDAPFTLRRRFLLRG